MLVGRVVKAHGIRGEVLIRVHSDNPSRFDPGSVLMVGNEPQSAATFRVEGSRLQRDALIVKFTSVDTRDEAERLRSALIFVGAEELAELEENAFWEHELIGLPVVDRAGRRLGYIDEIVSRPDQDLWRVETDGGPVLLPAVKEVVLSVDLEGGRVIADPPEGLFEQP